MSSEITKVSMEPMNLVNVSLVKVGLVRMIEESSAFH